MELITLKEASRITSLSYSYLFNHKSNLGFFKPLNKGKWLVDKKILEQKIKGVDNSNRLTSATEVKQWQSKSAVGCGIWTSSRQTDVELETLLERQTSNKRKSITIK